MADVKSEAKRAVLEEIMKLMDEHMSEGLKSKSPKFMKVEMEAEAKPEGEETAPEETEEMPTEFSDESEESDEEKLKRLYEELK